MSITVNDGQVGTAAAAIIPVGSPDGRYSITLRNTSASLTETILLTFTRSGGSSRGLKRIVLSPNESADVNNIPVGSGDSVLASTTDAATVDYLIALSGSGPSEVVSYDANGSKKGTSVGIAVAGLANGYKIARGVASVTGTGTVVTGLATVVSIQATPQTDVDGVTLANVSATIGDQAGAPAAGSVILKAWKVTTGGAAGNPTEIAATVACAINWLAVGT